MWHISFVSAPYSLHSFFSFFLSCLWGICQGISKSFYEYSHVLVLQVCWKAVESKCLYFCWLMMTVRSNGHHLAMCCVRFSSKLSLNTWRNSLCYQGIWLSFNMLVMKPLEIQDQVFSFMLIEACSMDTLWHRHGKRTSNATSHFS